MTCAAMGLLLRVSYEYDRAARQVAIRRAVSSAASVGTPPQAAQPPAPVQDSSRASSRLRQRVEPSMGKPAVESAAMAAMRRAR
jgi:cell division protein FtsW